ncbi:hypothetical protein Lser_V15G12445 [Lactuca serriola]
MTVHSGENDGTNRFSGGNCFGGNGYSNAGSNQICNLLPITANHVPSYNDPIDRGDYRSKGKAVVLTDPTVDVDESANDEEKLLLFVDDDNIIPDGEPVEHCQSYIEYDGDNPEGGEEKTDPLQP